LRATPLLPLSAEFDADPAAKAGSALDDDARIMEETAAGRIERFPELVARHQSSLFRVAISRLGNRSAAEDAVQETFLAVFRGRKSFRADRPFRPWMWTIHRNVCDASLKSEQRHQSAPLERIASSAAPVGEDQLLVRDLLERLPKEQAEAVRLRFFGSLTYDEIAAVQECPTPTAKNRVRYALAKLASLLDESESTSVRQK
jgi:RNA polymerase sigma-70 factor (ECF subfamily)